MLIKHDCGLVHPPHEAASGEVTGSNKLAGTDKPQSIRSVACVAIAVHAEGGDMIPPADEKIQECSNVSDC